MIPPPGGWIDYHWADCPKCGAITDEPCKDMRTKDRRVMYGTIHDVRPAFAIHRETGEPR